MVTPDPFSEGTSFNEDTNKFEIACVSSRRRELKSLATPPLDDPRPISPSIAPEVATSDLSDRVHLSDDRILELAADIRKRRGLRTSWSQ